MTHHVCSKLFISINTQTIASLLTSSGKCTGYKISSIIRRNYTFNMRILVAVILLSCALLLEARILVKRNNEPVPKASNEDVALYLRRIMQHHDIDPLKCIELTSQILDLKNSLNLVPGTMIQYYLDQIHQSGADHEIVHHNDIPPIPDVVDT